MPPRSTVTGERDFVEAATFWLVGIALAIVPALVFFFSFGNVGLLGASLGVDHWIAFLTGPAVDLSVAGCVIAASYLSAKGRTERELWPLHAAAIFCGLVMVALNTGGAIYARHWRLAAFDSVGPALLIGWGFIAPWLWRNMTAAKNARGTVRQRTENRPPAVPLKPSATDQDTATAKPSADGQTGQSVQPTTVQTPASSTIRANGSPSSATDQDDQEELILQIGRTVYEAVKNARGKRPPEQAFRDALADACAPHVEAGRLPKTYRDPSISTAKRVRTDVETRFPELSPLHLIREAS